MLSLLAGANVLIGVSMIAFGIRAEWVKRYPLPWAGRLAVITCGLLILILGLYWMTDVADASSVAVRRGALLIMASLFVVVSALLGIFVLKSASVSVDDLDVPLGLPAELGRLLAYMFWATGAFVALAAAYFAVYG